MDSTTLLSLLGIIAVSFLSLYSQVFFSNRRKKLGKKLASGLRIIDVRTPREFKGGHYPGAFNLPIQKLYQDPTKAGAKDASILVYCESGGRARRAKRILKAYGYEDVTNGGGLSKLMALQ